jgi:hypothetical protein
MRPSRSRVQSKKHCRCTSRQCGKRFKGHPGITACPTCGREGRLDRWAQSKPWRADCCDCGVYVFKHRMYGGACRGPLILPPLPGVVGLPF